MIPVRQDLDVSSLVASQPYMSVFFDQLKTARARLAHPRWSDMDRILTDAGQLILRHEQSPQAALDDAATKINEILGN